MAWRGRVGVGGLDGFAAPHPVDVEAAHQARDLVAAHVVAVPTCGFPQLADPVDAVVHLPQLDQPLAPELLCTLDIEGVDYGDNTEAVWGVSWQGLALYVGGTSTGLHVVDTTDLLNPMVAARLTTDELGGVIAGPLWSLGNHLVITTPKEFAGIATVDVTDPWNPGLLASTLPEPESYIGGFYGGEAYLLTPLRIYDVTTDPAAITPISSVETPDSEYISFGQEGFAFVGSLRPNAGTYKYRLGDLSEPEYDSYIEGRAMRGELRGAFIDDQFTLPIGNIVVLGDDEVSIGAVLAVHDTERDLTGPAMMKTFPLEGATQLPTTSRLFLSFSDQIDPDSLDTETIQVRPLTGPDAGTALPGMFGHAQTVVSFWPDAPFAENTSYEVVIPAGGVKDLVGNPIAETFTLTFATGDTVVSPTCAITNADPSEMGTSVTLGAADAGVGATYEWTVEDTTVTTDVPQLDHVFGAAARHSVRLRVTTAEGGARSCAATQVIHAPLREDPPTRSTAILVDDTRGRVFVTNPDAGTLTAIDAETLEVLWEVPAGTHPRTVAQAGDGRLWVTAEGDDALVILDPDGGAELQRVALRYGAGPHGIAAHPDGERLFVTLQGTAEVLALDPTGTVTGRVSLAEPGELAHHQQVDPVSLPFRLEWTYMRQFRQQPHRPQIGIQSENFPQSQ